MSALPAFAKEIEESQQLDSFKLSEYQFVFKPITKSEESFGNFMVLLADAKDKSESLNKTIELLVEDFENNFSLDDWNSNLEVFKPFQERCNEIIHSRSRKPLAISPEMLDLISDIISSSKYNFLILNKDNDIVLTSLKSMRFTKNEMLTADILNDIKDSVIQYSVFPPIFGDVLQTSFINTDKMLVIYDKILDHFFIAFSMKDENASTTINAYEVLQDVMDALDEIKFSCMSFELYDKF
ncbi:MAG: hypothetical protein ACFFCS_09545 [Candidatus Hodarchaeota archaeon]